MISPTKSKKAQFEAMGLAVIIVLISLGMFFMLFFSLRPSTDFPARYDREQASQNFVDAFIKTNANERCAASMEDLLLDATTLHRDPCGPNSKEILTEASKYMLEQTFADQVPYDFSVVVSGEDTPLIHHSTCISRARGNQAGQNDKPGIQDIPLLPTSRVATITLVLCLS
jgi:hypothetical protein